MNQPEGELLAKYRDNTDDSGRGEATVFSVSDINRLAKHQLESDFTGIKVEGEITELLQHRSGHWYFTLKDEHAQLRSAMFRFQNQRVTFAPENGQQVLLTGKLTIYEPRGSYQFVAESMEPAGIGRLQQAFAALKRQLAERGLFDNEHKKPLPESIRQVAIVTSPQSAALRDMLITFRRRFPAISIVVVPATVQGESAAAEIASAIEKINRLAGSADCDTAANAFNPDAIIVGRGGGSLEDLWAFNMAEVADAIFASEIPIVSAVGHETDMTIADFVADARAATPTAAAEMLSPEVDVLIQRLGKALAALQNRLGQLLRERQLQLQALAAQLQNPGALIQHQAQTVDYLDSRLTSAMRSQIAQARQKLDRQRQMLSAHSPTKRITANTTLLNQVIPRLDKAIGNYLRNSQNRFKQQVSSMHLVSPLATLARGYAIIEKKDGQIVRKTDDVAVGEQVTSRIANGLLHCKIEGSEQKSENE